MAVLDASYDGRGRHDLRAGAEYLWRHQLQFNRTNSMGEIDARTDSQVDEIFRRLMEERKTLLSIPQDLVVEREHHAYEEN